MSQNALRFAVVLARGAAKRAASRGRILAGASGAMGLGSFDSTDKSDTAAFGPNLRRIRLQRGVSLERIAADTKVGITLWAGLERNDLSRWPTGIYARAYVRAYAQAIGIDPEAAVDEFCRTFPHGDRRAEPTMRGHAEIVGHDDLDWRDELSGDDVERRADGVNAQSTPAIAPRANPLAAVVGRLRRVLLGRI